MDEKLLAALESRDAEAAAEVMRAHYRELDLDFANVIFGQAAVRARQSSTGPRCTFQPGRDTF
jgi:hypothetical protein